MVHNHIFSVEFVWFYHFACAYKEKVYWCSWSSFYYSCYLWPTIMEPYYTTWHVATLMNFNNYIQSLPFPLYFFVTLHSNILRQRILFSFIYPRVIKEYLLSISICWMALVVLFRKSRSTADSFSKAIHAIVRKRLYSFYKVRKLC